MTKREAAIVTAYTGFTIGKFSNAHQYIEEIMNRPVFIHELADSKLAVEIQQLAKKDFCAIEVKD